MNNKRGFSLIELTMMIAISAILLTGISRAVQTNLESAIEVRNSLIGLNLAKMQMAMMNNANYPAVSTTNPASDTSFSDFTFSQPVTTVTSSGTSSLEQIQLDTSLGGRVLVRLYTYRTNTVNTRKSITNYGFGDGT